MSNLPDFYACPKKFKARQKTLIDFYRSYFNRDSIPDDRQYWTMCGSHANENGEFQNGSELGQMLHSKFIKESQFFGVDSEESIIKKNKLAKPNVNWINEDFANSIRNAIHQNNFNPAVINADFIYMRKKSAEYTGKLMKYVECKDIREVFLACNIMLVNPHNVGKLENDKLFDLAINSGKNMIKDLLNCSDFVFAWSEGNWYMHPEFYIYEGTGEKSRTCMGTFLFVRN